MDVLWTTNLTTLTCFLNQQCLTNFPMSHRIPTSHMQIAPQMGVLRLDLAGSSDNGSDPTSSRGVGPLVSLSTSTRSTSFDSNEASKTCSKCKLSL